MNQKISTFFRIDDTVFFTMAGLIILSSVILAFRFATKQECPPIKIIVQTDSLVEENNISFKLQSASSESYTWDFGDSLTQKEEGNTVNHIYKKAGHYWVRVLSSGQCFEFTDVVIKGKNINVSPLLPIISGPDTAYIHEAATYRDLSSNSKTWEWYFGETSGSDATNKDATYTYLVPGPKKIKLEINNRPDLVSEKYVMVIDREALKKAMAEAANKSKQNKPSNGGPRVIVIADRPTVDPLKQQNNETFKPQETEKPKEKPVMAPDMSRDLLKSMLYEVAAGTKTANDFAPYLCNNLSMEISFDNKQTTFSKMCEELKSIGKKKIKEFPTIIIQKSGETNCIKTLTISIKKKGFLGL